LFRILLAGDIALATQNDALISEMEAAFHLGIPDDDTLVGWAKTCNVSENFYLVSGEPGCMMDPLFEKIILQRMRGYGAWLRFAPLSEMLLYEWGKAEDFAAYDAMQQLITKVDGAMGQCSVFSAPQS
jgi:hypothetical protein